MGIAQRLTVVKQHDTEPARSPPGRFTPNARSHGLPDAPQALRWGGVPAAKHPRKIAHHGPEPNFCTPFPTDGQVFSMQNPGRHASAQAAPSSARQCREACPHLPPLRAGRAPTPLVPARAPWSEHICRMHPERPDSGDPTPRIQRRARHARRTEPDAPSTAQTLVILSQPKWWTFATFGGQPPASPLFRPRFHPTASPAHRDWGCTADTPARVVAPPRASRRHAFAHQVAPRSVPTWTQRSAATPGAFVSAPRAARVAHLAGQKQ